MPIPVILCGGSGRRLWPLSRASCPKQFLDLATGGRASLLGATLRRLRPEAGFAPPVLLCSDDHRVLVRKELVRAGILARAVILEPVARDTAAAIAVAAVSAVETDPDAILVVMPSDHMIAAEEPFLAAVKAAAGIAATGKLVLFGVAPDRPHAGYGYMRRGEEIDGFAGAFRVEAFFEKPDRTTAETYLADDRFYWNSGIFVLRAATVLDELERLAPDVVHAALAAWTKAEADPGFLRLDRPSFERAPNVSLDVAVMEHTKRAVMLPVDVGWTDIGSWSALWEAAQRDAHGNHARGDALLEDTSGCYVHSERGLVATLGVEDLIVVATPDAVLVADRGRAEDVSRLVARLRRSNRKERHHRMFRSWGYYETLAFGPRFEVRRLHVDPGGKLSPRMHHHRSRHWVVVHGTAKVTIGKEERFVREHESVDIVAAQRHWLENPGKIPLELIEVQIGGCSGEKDGICGDDIHGGDPEQA